MRDPGTGGGGLTIPSEIKVNEMYFGTFVEVEDRPYSGPPRYNDDGTEQQLVSIVWKFTLRDHNKVQLIRKDDGEPYQQWRFTSDATGPGSIGRDIIQALAGREVSDSEVAQMLAADPEHMPTKLYGKSCLLIMGTYTSKKTGTQGVGITQILPLSNSDKDRLKQQLRQENAAAGAPALPVDLGMPPTPAETRMGPPAQRWDSQGNPAPRRTARNGPVQPARPLVAQSPQEGDDDDAPF